MRCYFSTKVVIGSEAQAWAASEVVTRRSREVSLTLCSGETPPAVLLWGPNTRRTLGVTSEEAIRMVRGLEHLCCEIGGELRWFSLERKRLQGGLTVAFQYLKGTTRKAEEGGFTRPGQGQMASG